jgi:ACS family hexuronate transporter-like MFS transporter
MAAQIGSSSVESASNAKPPARPTHFRWVICGLLFYATTVNYIDRGVFGVLAPTLQDPKVHLKIPVGHWDDREFGYINTAWTVAYAIGFLFAGRLIDKVGTRLGYAIAVTFWTLAAASHCLARTWVQFGICRFFLGLGEAGNFPAAIKSTAEWFPQSQRATATGIFNAGSNVGAILAPLIVPVVVANWDWPQVFLITPVLAAIWVVLWLSIYRTPSQHPKVNRAELELIESDSGPMESEKPVPWSKLLPHRQTWAIMVGKFLIDPIWWFYLFWSAKFFHDKFGVQLKGLAGPLILIYVMADFGSVAGGWFSSTLIRRGWTPNAARKTAMFTCAIAVLPVCAAPIVNHMWLSAVLIGIAASAHQGFSANIFTTTSDMFPKGAVASVVGLAGLCGAVGGIIMQYSAGVIKQATGSYLIMFCIAGSVYLMAAISVQLLAPRLTPVQLSSD